MWERQQQFIFISDSFLNCKLQRATCTKSHLPLPPPHPFSFPSQSLLSSCELETIKKCQSSNQSFILSNATNVPYYFLHQSTVSIIQSSNQSFTLSTVVILQSPSFICFEYCYHAEVSIIQSSNQSFTLSFVVILQSPSFRVEINHLFSVLLSY